MKDNILIRKDWNLLALCGALLLISVFYLGRNYRKAFPANDLDFKISRSESRIQAEKFLSRLDINLTGYHHAVIFDYDELPKIFIEKEVGLEEGARLLNQDFPIWRWSNRWFRPLSREEVRVGLSPDGRITYFEHILPEESAAPVLSIESARKTSRNFLVSIMQQDANEWEFIEDKTDIKPNRIDYYFTYKKRGIEVFNATYRLEIGVQGDKIGKYREYLKLPEQWVRSYQHMRSLNSTTAVSADIFFLLILIAALIVFIIHLNKKNVRFKTALWFGLITFILQLASQINELPIKIYAFDTNQSLGNYYGDYFIQTFLIALLYGLLVMVITGAGEALYRKAYPDHFALTRIFSPAGIRTKSFLISSVFGLSLAVVFIAFQTGFYLIANHFGAWAPAEVTYSDVLNTYFPWIFVLLVGFTPAVTEEFTFRLFAIPFFSKITRSRLLAVLIPALIWGFAHANYPNQPFWIRGVEVSMFGIFVGLIFLRFGILTVLVWHYTVDAIYSAFFLVKTGQPYLVVTASLAAGLIILPVLYNLFCYWRKRNFETASGLLNDNADISPEPITVEPEIPTEMPGVLTYEKFSPRKIRISLILTAVFLLILLIPVQKAGEFYRYPIPKDEIKNTAAEFLSEKGVDPGNFHIALGLIQNYDQLMGKYIIQHASLEQLNTILAQYLPDMITWEVRFFRSGERDEYRVYVHPMNNNVVTFNHILDETAPGINLSKENALLCAEGFLSRQNINLPDFKLAESNSQALPNRTDYNFIWESTEGHPANVAEAKLRLKITVKGDEIASYSTDYKIPEEWILSQIRRTTMQSVMTAIQIILLILIILWAVLYLLKKQTAGSARWQTAVRLALGIAGLSIIAGLLNHSGALLTYDTSWSLTNWNFLWLLLIILKAIGVAGVCALLLFCIDLLFPSARLTLRKTFRSQYSPDALIAAAVIISGLFACGRITNLAISQINPATMAGYFPITNLEESAFPFVDVALAILFRSVLALGAVTIARFLLRNLIGRTGLQVLFIIGVTAVFVPDNYLSLAEYFANYLRLLLPLLWVFISLRYFLGNNPPACVYTTIGYFAVSQIVHVMTDGSPNGRFTAAFWILLILIMILWLVTEKRDLNLRYLVKRYLK